MNPRIQQPLDSLNAAIWHQDITRLPWWKASLVWVARAVYEIVRDLTDGQLSLRAMSLVYTTLISFVPLIAVSFSVLKAFGAHNQVEPLLLSMLEPLGAQGVKFTSDIIGFVDNIKVGVLGSVGIGLLFFTVISLVQKVESAFNYTWRVRQNRSFTSRLSNYLTVILVGPVLVFTAIGVTASLMDSDVVKTMVAIEPFGYIYRAATLAIPYLLVGVAFTITYTLIPNTKVKPSAALTGGLTAGILWNVTGKLFATFMVQSAKYTAIYSGFAIVLLFMIWVYLSWLIMLVGASVAFYQQHPEYLVAGSHQTDLSIRLRERFGLRLMVLITREFYSNGPGWTLDTLAQQLNISAQAVSGLLDALEDRGLLVRTDRYPTTYVPGQPLEETRVKDVLEAVRSANENVAGRVVDEPDAAVVDTVITKIDAAVDQSLDGLTVKEMAMTEPTPNEVTLLAESQGDKEGREAGQRNDD
ncbi:MAG: YihY family inner membrane protein [Gammaproteobacteria bacterium]|jgi:membrane protein|nr:YihY family inner membrane protein [Gammaproteobacteria bacterium]